MRHKLAEFQQIAQAAKCASASRRHLRIRGYRIGPLRRNGANGSVIHTQQESLAGPVMAFADADELPAGKRMEGMRYADKMRCSGANACTPR